MNSSNVDLTTKRLKAWGFEYKENQADNRPVVPTITLCGQVWSELSLKY